VDAADKLFVTQHYVVTHNTIQAIGVSNADTSIRSVLIICPASLKLNWIREWNKWTTRPMSIGMANGDFPATDIVVINYDIVKKHRAAIDARDWDYMITDECHYLKNAKAQRTRIILGGGKGDTKQNPIAAKRRVFLSGTPIMNRPNELWTLVQSLDPKGLGANFFKFHARYCDARQTQWGWDFSGASNLDELQRKLRETIMIRRLKSEVLAELPPKQRQIIEVTFEGADKLIAAEKAAQAAQETRLELLRLAVLKAEAEGSDEEYQEAVRRLRSENMVAFTEMSRVRHATAVAKIPSVIEHLESAIESSGRIIFFAHHLDVLHAIKDHFGEAAVLFTGETKLVDRDAAVARFQTDPTCRLFVGGIIPAGVGITLTASNHVVFGELEWRPGMISQAEDRAHRIGQENSVLVQHLVVDGSLDARMAHVIVDKQEIIDRALDKGQAAAEADLEMPDSFPHDEPNNLPAIAAFGTTTIPTAPAPVQTVAKPAERDLTADEIAAIHAALRRVAAMDSDRALELNGVGFSRIDGDFGHSLANAEKLTQRQAKAGLKLCQKYRRQIGTDLRRDFGF
jgi:SWI/SNF-related matrix-associated actin-dependent regulator 1 of chromatin subfamily A